MSAQTFEEWAEKIKTLKKDPSDQEKLKLYGLFKQATVGDVNKPCPGMLEVKEKAKWGAWNDVKGMSSEEAKKQYSEFAATVYAKYS